MTTFDPFTSLAKDGVSQVANGSSAFEQVDLLQLSEAEDVESRVRVLHLLFVVHAIHRQAALIDGK